jgi:hypothetical protein
MEIAGEGSIDLIIAVLCWGMLYVVLSRVRMRRKGVQILLGVV